MNHMIDSQNKLSFDDWSSMPLDDVLNCNEIYTVQSITKNHNNVEKIDDKIQNITIDEILISKIEELSENALLEYSVFMISQIKKILYNCKENNLYYDNKHHLNELKWLANACEILSKKHNLPNRSNIKKGDSISRNSYRFCEYSYNCNTFYKKHKKCTSGQHYVYNYVKADIDQVLDYLNIDTKKININEVYVSISTIKYVMEHMYDELIKSSII